MEKLPFNWVFCFSEYDAEFTEYETQFDTSFGYRRLMVIAYKQFDIFMVYPVLVQDPRHFDMEQWFLKMSILRNDTICGPVSASQILIPAY